MSHLSTASDWLRKRESVWRSLASRIKTSRRGKVSLNDLNEVVHGYRSIARDLAVAREVAPDAPATGQLERLYVQTHEFIHTRRGGGLAGLWRIFWADGPRTVRQRLFPIAVSTALFIGATIGGWLLTSVYPDTASLFASPAMIEKVEAGELWTDGLLGVTPASVISWEIITNNVGVTLFAFVLGAFYGIGTLYIIGFNGLMLGSIFAFTGGYGMAGRLFDFVVAHGVVELSVIAMAGGLGICLGEALVQPGNRTRAEAFSAVVSDAARVLVVIIPYLVVAGVIEGHVSTDAAFSTATRVIIGFGFFALMFAHLAFAGRRS